MSEDRYLDATSRGKFIVFEGIDGSGKSTQVQLLADRLTESGVRVHTTREPSDGPVGNLIRQSMAGRVDLDDKVIAGLFVADRLDHLVNSSDGVLKLLREGVTVISDRYYFSSYAYHADYVNMDWIVAANGEARRLLRADLTLFVDTPPEIAVDRIKASRHRMDRYEDVGRLCRVRDAYLKSFEICAPDENVEVVNGDFDVEHVRSFIWNEVTKLDILPA